VLKEDNEVPFMKRFLDEMVSCLNKRAKFGMKKASLGSLKNLKENLNLSSREAEIVKTRLELLKAA
jgi:hypothetical protein